jgi:tRNA-specific 2-thiouridylase
VGTLAEIPADGIDVYARVRSTRAPLPARLSNLDGHFAVDLGDGEAGVAPGQACVLYDGDAPGARVLGGGFIEKAEHAREAETALRRLIASPAVQAVA